jgi:hypothetical protein
MALTLELSAGTAASSQKNETTQQQPNIRNPCWHISYIVSGIYGVEVQWEEQNKKQKKKKKWLLAYPFDP